MLMLAIYPHLLPIIRNLQISCHKPAIFQHFRHNLASIGNNIFHNFRPFFMPKSIDFKPQKFATKSPPKNPPPTQFRTILVQTCNKNVQQNACGKLEKIVTKLFKKVIDISEISRYYRGSFWIKKLFKRSKQKYSQNNSTLYIEDRFSSQLPVFFVVWNKTRSKIRDSKSWQNHAKS